MEDTERNSGACAAACGSFVVIDGSFLVHGGFTGVEESIFCTTLPTRHLTVKVLELSSSQMQCGRTGGQSKRNISVVYEVLELIRNRPSNDLWTQTLSETAFFVFARACFAASRS